jgi:arylsulfatase A-like enzyme
LVAAFLDAAVASLHRSSEIGVLKDLAPALALGVLGFLVVFGVLTTVGPRFAPSLLTFVTTAYVLGALRRLPLLPTASRPAVEWLLILVVATLAGAGAHCLASSRNAARHSARALAAPWLALALLVGARLATSSAGSGWLRAAGLVAALLLVGTLTVAAATAIPRRALAGAAWGLLVVVLLGLAVPLLAGGHAPVVADVGGESPGPVERVLLITIDTFRADQISPGITPRLDELRADSVDFATAASPAPWTLPGIASILTGLPPTVHLATGRRSRVPDSLPTLAERLQDAGYATAAFGSNSYLRDPFNVGQGFDHYRAFHGVPPPAGAPTLGSRLLRFLGWPPGRGSWASTDRLTGMAVEWLRQNHDRPFFLWVHYFDPHVPYAPPVGMRPKGPAAPAIGFEFDRPQDVRSGRFVPTRDERAWIRALYDAESRYVDSEAGKLLDVARELGIYDDALIVLTSDHGEEFWEHGGFEHGHTLYREVLDVPLMFKLPGGAPTGRVELPVSIESVMPTVLEVCGLPVEDAYLAERSLVSRFDGGNDEPVPDIIGTGMHFYEERIGVTFGDWKYMRSLTTEHEELYDRSGDPGERESVASLHPEVLQEARERIEAHLERAAELRHRYDIDPSVSTDLDPETRERLRTLGYVQ